MTEIKIEIEEKALDKLYFDRDEPNKYVYAYVTNEQYLYKVKVLDLSREQIGFAYIELKPCATRTFWHLEDLLIYKKHRKQGYGTALLNYIPNYLWNIKKLGIRVHPANCQQGMEDFLEHRQPMNYDSHKLTEWYRKRGFTVDDLDKKQLWCYPS